MEFGHVGTHCQYEACNQQDFLPFSCSQCSKTLCLLHRSPVAHSCSGTGRNDVTSMDCPICGKSIKMNKTDDPNAEWNRHFSTVCTQKPQVAKTAPLLCISPVCQTVIGPSNHIICKHCHRKVCLVHRTPESHDCATFRRADELKRINKLAASSSAKKTSNPSRSSSSKPSLKTGGGAKTHSSAADASNTLRGTAERRKQLTAQAQDSSRPVGVSAPVASASNAPVSLDPCPFCGESFSESAALVAHVEQAHAADTPAPPAPSPISAPLAPAPISRGAEICPQCSQPFGDVVELIRHVESAHGNATNGGNCAAS